MNIPELNNKLESFAQVIKLKSDAEYGERNLSKNDADLSIRNTEKFFKFVKNILIK